MKKYVPVIGGLFVAGVMATAVYFDYQAKRPTPTLHSSYHDRIAKEKCQAGPNEQCPSDLWLSDYDQLMALNEKYKVPQKEQDYINGLAARLRADIPQGFQWDEKKLRFVRNPITPVPEVKK